MKNVVFWYIEPQFLRHGKHITSRKMPPSEMLPRVGPVKTDVSEGLSASIISVTRIGELGTTLGVTSNRRNIPEDSLLLIHRCENLISYILHLSYPLMLCKISGFNGSYSK
jgi:hypothetical protein